MIQVGDTLPSVTFKTRYNLFREVNQPGYSNENAPTEPEQKWIDKTTTDLFGTGRVVIFGLPGAFTPTCSMSQVPGYSANYDEFMNRGISEVYCVSVNDAFVMNRWFNEANWTKVVPVPDGSGLFTNAIGMLVSKDNLGFGQRSWRYAMVANNGVVEQVFSEPNVEDNCEFDPYDVSKPENVLTWLDANPLP